MFITGQYWSARKKYHFNRDMYQPVRLHDTKYYITWWYDRCMVVTNAAVSATFHASQIP
jgi:hypothetical protein